MEKQSTIQKKNNYLLVTAHGDRDNLKEVMEGTRQIQEAAAQHNTRFVVADYREIFFNVNQTDAVNLVKMYDFVIPEFSNMLIAVVTNYASIELARYWEELCHQRGYNFKIFLDLDKAEIWIKDKVKQPNYQQ